MSNEDGKEALDTDTVTITKEEYNELLEEQAFLDCLRGAGVDNWEGYEFAIDDFQATYEALEED